MNKILFYIVLGILVILGAFHLAFTDSFCMATATFETALWNSYNIASEYYCARAGRNIVNSDKVSMDITGVSGINDGYMSESYGDIISSSATGSPIDINNLIALAQDVDTSNMSLEQLNTYSALLANSPWNTDGSIVMKNIAFGGLNLYFAVDKLGNWLGNSYDNIVAKFNDMTVSKAMSITNKAESIFPQTTSLRGYSNSLSCKFGRTSYQGQTADVLGYVSFSQPVYFYSVQQVNDTNEYYVGVMRPSDYDITQNYTGSFTYYTISTGESHTRFVDKVSMSSTHTVTYNGVSYVYGTLQISVENNSSSGTVTTYGQFATLADAQNFYQGLNVNTNTEYQSELLDTSGVPYLVDDLNGYASTISDLYPVIESLREVISTIPTTGDLTSTITDALKGTITDIIDAIKAQAITIETTAPSPEPNPNDPEVPDWFWPSFFPDLIPDDMFSMFQPVFDIVGTNYSMYSIWIVIPSILIFILILYIIISVF